jgi:hypothetical protein
MDCVGGLKHFGRKVFVGIKKCENINNNKLINIVIMINKLMTIIFVTK